MAPTITPQTPGPLVRRSRARTGAVGAALALAVAALASTGCTIIERASAKAEPLQLGDCLLVTGTEDDLSRNNVVPCEDLHDWEIFHIVPADPGMARPDSIDAAYEDPSIAEPCLEEAVQVVDLTLWEQGKIEFQLLLPNQEFWDAGIQEIYCVVDSVGASRVGSVLVAEVADGPADN